jgi:hypothetical protein
MRDAFPSSSCVIATAPRGLMPSFHECDDLAGEATVPMSTMPTPVSAYAPQFGEERLGIFKSTGIEALCDKQSQESTGFNDLAPAVASRLIDARARQL